MKNLKYLFIAVVTLGLSTFFACNGSSEESNQDTTVKEEVSSEPQVIEETKDTTVVEKK